MVLNPIPKHEGEFKENFYTHHAMSSFWNKIE